MIKNVSSYYTPDEEKELERQAFSRCMKKAEYVKYCVLERNKTSEIKHSWGEAAKKYGYTDTISFLDQAVNGFFLQPLPINPDEKSQKEIEYLENQVSELQKQLGNSQLQAQERVYVGNENVDNWFSKLCIALIKAKGKWITVKKLNDLFTFRDDNDSEDFQEAMWKHLINAKEDYEFNFRNGFRLKNPEDL